MRWADASAGRGSVRVAGCLELIQRNVMSVPMLARHGEDHDRHHPNAQQREDDGAAPRRTARNEDHDQDEHRDAADEHQEPVTPATLRRLRFHVRLGGVMHMRGVCRQTALVGGVRNPRKARPDRCSGACCQAGLCSWVLPLSEAGT